MAEQEHGPAAAPLLKSYEERSAKLQAGGKPATARTKGNDAGGRAAIGFGPS